MDYRKSSQKLLPKNRVPILPGQYDLYPVYPIGHHKIQYGFEKLANELAHHRIIVIDGYVGVLWERFRDRLQRAFAGLNIQTNWIAIAEAFRAPEEIDALLMPFLGGDDPIFGAKTTVGLRDFFDEQKLAAIQADPEADINLIYGAGAFLADFDAFHVYVDAPKNEIQYRFRAGSIVNLGAAEPDPPKEMYKRFYFVDWAVLNRHKAQSVHRIDLIIDEQDPDDPAFMTGGDWRAGLASMTRSCFRVRPWFEPGVWGGQWLKQHIPALAQGVPNYAWGFEMIAPEQGVIFESDGKLLEVSFDWLMVYDHEAILGDFARYFGYEFPIRFDFLDTFDGGNLSLQCHPGPEYIRRHFGESFTQDETYYILDCRPGAQVYLGFQPDIEPGQFRDALERSFAEGVAVEIEKFVKCLPARKHDLFLIPHGTVHCAGKDNLVLEISATPYIFTFKMYDWLRADLDGKPRPLNIARAFENLNFERRGHRVEEELVAKPRVMEEGEDWRVIHLPTHRAHFYDVYRLEFRRMMEMRTNGSVQVLMVIEGNGIKVELEDGVRRGFSFAETFIVPALAGRYRLINESDDEVKVIRALLKPEWFELEENQWLNPL